MSLRERVKNWLFAEETREQPIMGEQGETANRYLGALSTGQAAVQDDLTAVKGVSVYDKMQHDPDVKGALLIKTGAVWGKGWEITPGVEEGEEGYQQAVEAADFVKLVFDDMQGSIDERGEQILRGALVSGIGIAEKVWELRADGKIGLKDLKHKDPQYYSFKLDAYNNIEQLLLATTGGNTTLDIEKFAILTYDGEYGNPWGVSDLRAAYPYWLMKESFRKWWGIFLEKYGSPTAKGTYKPGTKKEDQSALLTVLQKIKQESAIVVPEGQEIELLTAGGGTLGSGYDLALDFCSKQIVKAILGSTLATEQGTKGSGSYAQAETHADTIATYIRKLKRQTEEYFDEQVLRQLTDFNFIGAPYPNFTLQLGEKDIQQLSEVIFRLIQSEVVDPRETWLRDFLGLPAREELPELPEPPKPPITPVMQPQDNDGDAV